MTKKLIIDILAKDKTKQALTGVQKNLGNVKKSVFSLKGALVGLGAGAVVKSFVNVGKEVESLQVRFKFLFGSVEEGKIAFDNLAKFAGKVPFSLEEISRASGNLAVVAKDANDLNRILEITGNVAAVTGLDFETTSSQIQRAFSGGIGAADLFRERGVRALLGFQAGAKVTAEETIARFEELFAGDGQFAKATKDLATTLEGTISMIGDKYFNFQKDVAAGFFDELKGEFGDLNVFLEQNEQQIKDIATAIGENFAGAIKTTSSTIKSVAPAVKTIADGLGTTITGFTSLPTFVQTSGIISVLLFGKKGTIALTTVSFLIGQIQDLLNQVPTTSKELLDVKSLEEAEEVLSSFQDRLQRKEMLFLENFGIQAKDIANIDFSEATDGLIKRVNDILELRDAIDEAQIVVTNFKSENFTKFLKDTKVGFTGMNEKIVEFNRGFQTSTELVNKQASAFGGAYMTSVLLAEKTVDGFTDSLTLASQQSSAFGNAYIDALNKSDKTIEEQLSAFERFNKGFNDAMDKSVFDGFQKAGETAFNSLKKTMADFVITGKLDMKGFSDAVKRAIVEALIGEAVTAAISKAKTLFKMDAIKKALINVYEAGTKALASVPPPFNFALAGAVIAGGMSMVNRIKGFEKGGRPPVGQPSIVGEAGAELFVPDTAGTIIPNNKLGNMGQTTVNVNIMANDTEGFDDLLLKRRSVIVNVINDALNTQGKEALI